MRLLTRLSGIGDRGSELPQTVAFSGALDAAIGAATFVGREPDDNGHRIVVICHARIGATVVCDAGRPDACRHT